MEKYDNVSFFPNHEKVAILHQRNSNEYIDFIITKK